MLEAIKQARFSIYIEMYIFLDDTYVSHDFYGLLKSKAREGVKVKIIVDALGTKLKAKTVAELRGAGVELLFFSQWLHHIHKKVVIVDEKVAFIGGVNIGKHMQVWDDLQLRLTGAVVKRLLAGFAKAYAWCGGRADDVLLYQKQFRHRRLKFRLVEFWAENNHPTLQKFYLEKINQAKQSVTVVTPYFAPRRWLLAALDNAVKRGVTVKVLLPLRSDLAIANRVNLWFASQLAAQGVEFFLAPQMNHAKILLIDEQRALVGSQNLDILSFEYNIETGVFFDDQQAIAELNKIIAVWLKDAELFRQEKYLPHLADRLVGFLLGFLWPWL